MSIHEGINSAPVHFINTTAIASTFASVMGWLPPLLAALASLFTILWMLMQLIDGKAYSRFIIWLEWRFKKMRHVTLIRDAFSSSGTFGRFILDDGTEFCSGELPWRYNQHDISCIPPALDGPPEKYLCRWLESPKHGWCYHVTGVRDRSNIEIHPANYMGDTSLGMYTDLLGCITIGMSVRTMQKEGYPPQMGIALSKYAIDQFEENMNHEDFVLTIENKND